MLYQILDHLKNREKYKLSIKKLDQYMQNMGRGQFNYEVFKAAFDSDPKIQNIVADFDEESITLKSDETDDLDQTGAGQGGGDSVGTMAKRAVDLDDL